MSTNPTPEQVAAARECAVAWLARVEDNVIHLAKRADVDSLSKHLAALLAEREIATLEKAAKLVCAECREELPLCDCGEPYYWHHKRGDQNLGGCLASPIHALIAQLKEADGE